jgi:hypothetical protein
MKRDIDEVLISQTKMLHANNILPENTTHFTLETKFQTNEQKIEAWINNRINIDCLYINYKDIILEPEKHIDLIADFLNVEVDTDKVKSKIDATKYRNRK